MNTAAYDDSDGWYDHVMTPIVNDSQTPFDALTGKGTTAANTPLGTWQGPAGHGPRLPLCAISPFAKENFADHTITDQSSILRFIEDNWKLGRIGNGSFDELAGSQREPHDRRLFLDPNSGEPTR